MCFMWETIDSNSFCVLLSVQFSSVTQSCPTLWDAWTAASQAALSITNSQNLLKLMSVESVMPSNRLVLCRPFSSCPHLSSESALHARQPSAGPLCSGRY